MALEKTLNPGVSDTQYTTVVAAEGATIPAGAAVQLDLTVNALMFVRTVTRASSRRKATGWRWSIRRWARRRPACRWSPRRGKTISRPM